jgi:hypothetical protein
MIFAAPRKPVGLACLHLVLAVAGRQRAVANLMTLNIPFLLGVLLLSDS